MTQKKKTSAKDLKAAETAKFEKAKQDAAEKRAESRKMLKGLLGLPEAKKTSLRKQLVSDLKRVYNHPLNPYKGFAASRKRYRHLGFYPEAMVEAFFGNHAEFQRAAGLADLRGTTTVRNKAARLHTHQQIAKFADENVKRFHGRFERLDQKRKHIEGVVVSDLHSKFCDPFALEVFFAYLRMVNPDYICINGDGVDFPQFSRHRQLPGHFGMNAWEECQWLKDVFKRTREMCPEAQIDFVIGNHEIRLVHYLADAAQALACFPSLSFEEIFGLTDYEVNLVCRANFLTPTARAKKKDVRENWTVIGGCYAITHGTSCAKFAAQVQLDVFQMSGTSGHTHRPQIYYGNSLGGGPKSWMSTPMMAHPSVGSDYVPTPTQWNGGFGRFALFPDKKLVSQELVMVHLDVASFAGAVWTPTAAALKARKIMESI